MKSCTHILEQPYPFVFTVLDNMLADDVWWFVNNTLEPRMIYIARQLRLWMREYVVRYETL